jgi:Domain of unknown function (DUF4177)
MTFEYKVVTSEVSANEAHMPNLDEVNELALDGWELMEMAQMGGAVRGRFWYLLKRNATPGTEKKNG